MARSLRLTRVPFVGVGSAVFLSLIMATSALAATWVTPTQLSSAAAPSGDVDVASSSSLSAVAVFSEEGSSNFGQCASSCDVYIRRTGDGGLNWTSPSLVSFDGQYPAVAARGSAVDVVYNTSDGVVWYRRSPDGGVTFGSPLEISPAAHHDWSAAVAHGPNNVVAIAYVDADNLKVSVRVSTNGGANFAAAKVLSTIGNRAGIALAVGQGVIYVAYSIYNSRLLVTHSADGGTTWSSVADMTISLGSEVFSVAADGTHAYVAYTTAQGWGRVHYRRTLNSGSSWSPEMHLAPGTWSAFAPDVALAGGVLRAAFTRCTPHSGTCDNERVYYMQSGNGTSWGTPQRVSPTTVTGALYPKVAAQRPLVVYFADDTVAPYAHTYARTKH